MCPCRSSAGSAVSAMPASTNVKRNRWHGGVGRQAAEGTVRREREAQANAGGCDARQCRAEGSLGKEVVTPAARRKAVAHLVAINGMSERRACKAIGCCRMMIRYQSIRPDDTLLRERMCAIARERRRFGYRRLHVMLKREGLTVNYKKLFRLYIGRRSYAFGGVGAENE